jgi:hypothetical protein
VPRPAVPIFFAWAVLAAAAALAGGGRVRGVALAALATSLTLGVVEAALDVPALLRAPRFREEVVRWPFGIPHARVGFQRDPLLGWRPEPGTQVRELPQATSYRKWTLTIGPDGWRRGSSRAPAAAPEVAVFGDSFPFGFRLDDDSTMPYLLEEASGGAFDVTNISVSGYGPHQTVAILEQGLERRALAGKRVVLGVWVGAFDPIRPTGQRMPGFHGPSYALDASGRPVYRGQIEDVEPFREVLRRRSALGERLGAALWPVRSDLDLYLGLLTRVGELFSRRYRAPFLVVLGPPRTEAPLDPFLARMRARGLEAWSFESLLPQAPPATWWIPNDGHPTRAANEVLARRILFELKRSPVD